MKKDKRTDASTRALFGRAIGLEWFTVGYNTVEAAVSIFFGGVAASIALVGFGLDSVAETLSGAVLLWRLSVHGKVPAAEEERIESRATRLVGLTFLVLAGYILFESCSKLVLREGPSPSLAGIVIAAVSGVVMPVLAKLKYDLGRKIGSAALVADSKETMACSFLSYSLLLGLGMNYCFGFWWADPVTGLVITGYLVKEGVELWRGGCGDCGDKKPAKRS
jgi:divalent metal cation (Fe/Co/Zn/Cd) transporter